MCLSMITEKIWSKAMKNWITCHNWRLIWKCSTIIPIIYRLKILEKIGHHFPLCSFLKHEEKAILERKESKVCDLGLLDFFRRWKTWILKNLHLLRHHHKCSNFYSDWEEVYTFPPHFRYFQCAFLIQTLVHFFTWYFGSDFRLVKHVYRTAKKGERKSAEKLQEMNRIVKESYVRYLCT